MEFNIGYIKCTRKLTLLLCAMFFLFFFTKFFDKFVFFSSFALFFGEIHKMYMLDLNFEYVYTPNEKFISTLNGAYSHCQKNSGARSSCNAPIEYYAAPSKNNTQNL